MFSVPQVLLCRVFVLIGSRNGILESAAISEYTGFSFILNVLRLAFRHALCYVHSITGSGMLAYSLLLTLLMYLAGLFLVVMLLFMLSSHDHASRLHLIALSCYLWSLNALSRFAPQPLVQQGPMSKSHRAPHHRPNAHHAWTTSSSFALFCPSSSSRRTTKAADLSRALDKEALLKFSTVNPGSGEIRELQVSYLFLRHSPPSVQSSLCLDSSGDL
ncbi:hypothetical protein C8J56DRAFT_1058228 [Mycena floridula]|nr:hypothetical protein C8J56DRAFT_1064489 [Mycena floridula]KAJ7580587.1 hypothetical protein C8J56DRAFT_1058228 [Mycena floridula]